MKKILIIDDSKQVRLFLKEAFSAQDFDVYEAENGKHGITIYNLCKPDLIFCDLEMPFMNGIEFAQYLHLQHQDKITLMTATPLDLLPEEYFYTQGVDKIIHKSQLTNDLKEFTN